MNSWLRINKLLIFCTLVFGVVFAETPETLPAGTEIETFFSPTELAALERLVQIAEANSPAVLEAQAALRVGEVQLELTGRLAESLTINVGVDFDGDIYGQISPSYRISAGLDIIGLLDVQDQTAALSARLAAARSQSRSGAAAAYIRYVVAQQAAQAAALNVESASAVFGVTQARLEIGEATVGDQLAAQSTVSDAAIGLLRANGEIVIALESLAAVVGLPPERTLEVIRGAESASGG